jgi:uncharacterized Rossmann fold enzyme
MIFIEWEKIYKKIKQDLNLNFNKDEISSIILDKLIRKRNIKYDIKKIRKLIKNQDVVIFGAGPSLKNTIRNNLDLFNNKIIISADGATSALIKYNIIPDIIVTDLDGELSDQINANSNHSIIFLHSHGDNIISIKENIQKFKGILFGTTQLNPSKFKNLYNFGGFTDGDRAVLLASHFEAKKIYLIGFDFDGEIGEYSNIQNKNVNKKLKKLKWCKNIINLESKRKNIKFIR